MYTVAMLDQYTEHLMVSLVEIIKKYVPEIIGGYMSAGSRQLKADPENDHGGRYRRVFG